MHIGADINCGYIIKLELIQIVAILSKSMVEHDLYVYTDDKTQIQKYITGNKGIERSAHEISCMSQV